MLTYLTGYKAYLTTDKKRSCNTADAYVSDLRQFYVYLVSQGIKADDVRRVNKTNIYSFIMDMSSAGKSNSTVLRSLASIKSFFKYLHKTGVLDVDVAEDISHRLPKPVRSDAPSNEDIMLLINAAGGKGIKGIRDRAILELFYATGMRVSEIADIRLTDVLIELRYINCGRIIPIGDAAANAIREYITNARDAYKPKTDTLFVNKFGRKLTRQGLWKLIKHYSVIAGVGGNITPQSLRQSFAAHLLQNGADVYTVKEMMGHSDVVSTQKYLGNKTQSLHDVYKESHPRG